MGKGNVQAGEIAGWDGGSRDKRWTINGYRTKGTGFARADRAAKQDDVSQWRHAHRRDGGFGKDAKNNNKDKKRQK